MSGRHRLILEKSKSGNWKVKMAAGGILRPEKFRVKTSLFKYIFVSLPIKSVTVTNLLP